MKVLPLFTSAYSLRSILTLDKPKDSVEGGPDSIIKICEDEKLDTLYLVEDNMVGFLEAKKNAGKKINLRFGLRITICADMNQKIDESRKTEAKYVIFARNPNGYFRLTQIFTSANADGFFGYPRIDFKTLRQFWSEDDLMLIIPFYDSFIHKNTCYLSSCLPDFSFTKPTFFIENNGLYYEGLLQKAIQEFDRANDYERQETKTIYYKDRKDFSAWQTYKCIKNESTLRVPNLQDCMSDAFCVEAWKEVNV